MLNLMEKKNGAYEEYSKGLKNIQDPGIPGR